MLLPEPTLFVQVVFLWAWTPPPSPATPPLKIPFSFIFSFKNFAFYNPHPPGFSNGPPWGGYGDFLEPHNACFLHSVLKLDNFWIMSVNKLQYSYCIFLSLCLLLVAFGFLQVWVHSFQAWIWFILWLLEWQGRLLGPFIWCSWPGVGTRFAQ